MSLSPDDLEELLKRARQVIAVEASAVLRASESLDPNFVAVAEVILACSPTDVAAIAVSGQQHGLVMVDGHGRVLRDVKLWNDTETADIYNSQRGL
jgi:sugar (pentulose or hexulose) kinase